MSSSQFRSKPRRGVILVIVIACLALFLAVGLAFVFYANQQAISMRYQREAANGGRAANVNQFTRGVSDEAPPQAVDLFNLALGTLIYDAPDDETGYYNGLRGHSLARAMYGWKNATDADKQGNIIPYNGFGRVHHTPSSPPPGADPALNADTYSLINYTRLPFGGSAGVIRNPERESGSYIAKNAPYTYPDENNLYLAAVRASDGKVLVPSFHRPWLTQSNFSGTNKYRMLRPNTTDNPNFPPPLQNSTANGVPNGDLSWGDVENLEGKPASAGQRYDSFWVDLDAPVQTWRGRKYKPLFAFLVVDLDGRINVNVAGNRRNGVDDSSNQGWGPWEVQLGAALGSGFENALSKRFGGSPTASYSIDGGSTTIAPGGTGAPGYSGVDFDAFGPGNKVAYPLDQYLTSPTWGERYNYNNGSGEAQNHPLLYNSYLVNQAPAGGTNVAFPPRDMYFLNNKFFGGAGLVPNAQLAKTVPSLQGIASTALNNRYTVTTFSNDIDRPGTRPWIPAGGANYNQATKSVLPQGPSIDSPAPGAAPVGGNNDSDFDANWRSTLATALGAVDLNRKLTDYRADPKQPFEAVVSGQPNGVANFLRAQTDRQMLAKDIFDRLCAATGALMPGETMPTPPSQRYDALRRLAQIAVNMVDYIDFDDYITPFNWNTQFANMADPAHLKNGWVFGQELPRLVINEVYYTWDNDPKDLPDAPVDPMTMKRTAMNKYKYQIYAELHNPLTPGGKYDNPNAGKLSHDGGAPVVFNDGAQTFNVYQLLIVDRDKLSKISDADNVLGDTDDNNVAVKVEPLGDVNDKYKGVVPKSNYKLGSKPADAASMPENPSLYVIGPKNVLDQKATLPGNDNVVLACECPKMEAEIGDGEQPGLKSLVLRRLLCPHQPPSASNPYITVDYFETKDGRGQIFDHRKYLMKNDGGGQNNAQQKLADHYSYGRNQPYAGDGAECNKQTANPAPTAGDDTAINHTFYKHNTDAGGAVKPQFDWLVHLDRALISPAEVMYVSAWKPHELTHRFIDVVGTARTANRHYANWNDIAIQAGQTNDTANKERLYRALGLLKTGNRVYGMGNGGRVPGLVNINTIWDQPVFNAVCSPDSQGSNYYAQQDVDAAWAKVVANRNIGKMSGNQLAVWSATTLSDKPYLPPAAAGHTSAGDPNLQYASQGVQTTVLNLFDSNTTNQDHPYLKNELLTKAMNNFTTRSNTFAVWCTIGYFEVENEGPYGATNRPRLGAELGKADGSNVRHKFFALIDRTNLTIDINQTNSTDTSGNPQTPRFLQGDRPIFLSYQPLNTPGNSPNPTGTDLTMPDPDTTATDDVTVRLPATSPTAAGPTSKIQGIYDGATWTMVAGDHVFIDLSPNREEFEVVSIDMKGPTVGADVKLRRFAAPGNPAKRPHYRGAIIQLHPYRSTLGNPGPQPNFNYKDSRYTPVVPFVTQIN